MTTRMPVTNAPTLTIASIGGVSVSKRASSDTEAAVGPITRVTYRVAAT